MASAPQSSDNPPRDKSSSQINRGQKGRDLPGTLTFVGLRAVEPLLQYGILAHGVGSSLIRGIGLETLPAGPPNTGTAFDSFGLSPYRLILFGMSVGAAAKHVWWCLSIGQEEMKPGFAAGVAAFNGVINSLNSLLFTCSLTSASLSSGSKFPQTTLLVGAAVYTTGILIEAVSEVQRKKFKSDSTNKGKAYTGGLWSISRHANYLGYTLWRTGFAFAAGGWTWGALNAGFLTFAFINNSIPELEKYCQDKYGTQWDEYKRKTPYELIPYIY